MRYRGTAQFDMRQFGEEEDMAEVRVCLRLAVHPMLMSNGVDAIRA